jgi:hypothetical protein
LYFIDFSGGLFAGSLASFVAHHRSDRTVKVHCEGDTWSIDGVGAVGEQELKDALTPFFDSQPGESFACKKEGDTISLTMSSSPGINIQAHYHVTGQDARWRYDRYDGENALFRNVRWRKIRSPFGSLQWGKSANMPTIGEVLDRMKFLIQAAPTHPQIKIAVWISDLKLKRKFKADCAEVVAVLSAQKAALGEGAVFPKQELLDAATAAAAGNDFPEGQKAGLEQEIAAIEQQKQQKDPTNHERTLSGTSTPSSGEPHGSEHSGTSTPSLGDPNGLEHSEAGHLQALPVAVPVSKFPGHLPALPVSEFSSEELGSSDDLTSSPPVPDGGARDDGGSLSPLPGNLDQDGGSLSPLPGNLSQPDVTSDEMLRVSVGAQLGAADAERQAAATLIQARRRGAAVRGQARSQSLSSLHGAPGRQVMDFRPKSAPLEIPRSQSLSSLDGAPGHFVKDFRPRGNAAERTESTKPPSMD